MVKPPAPNLSEMRADLPVETDSTLPPGDVSQKSLAPVPGVELSDAHASRPRFADPAGRLEKQIAHEQVNPAADKNGWWGVLKEAGLGFLQNGVWGAGGRGLSNALDKSSDERREQGQTVGQWQGHLAQLCGNEKAALDREQQRAGTRLTNANADYAEKYKPLEAEQRAAQRERTMIGQNLRLRKGQKLDPANPRDAALLDRAERAGIVIDVEEWNNSASNLVSVTVVDPNNPTQTRQQYFNKATGQLTDVAQKGYVQPVKPSGMTEAQERADADRDATRAATAERFDKTFGLGVARYQESVRSRLSSEAKRSFDVETKGHFDRGKAIEKEIADLERRKGQNLIRASEANPRIDALRAEAVELSNKIESSRSKYGASVTGGGRSAAPAGGGAYKGQRIPRANLKAAASRLGVSTEAKAERIILREGGTFDELATGAERNAGATSVVDGYKVEPARLVTGEVLRPQNAGGRDVVIAERADGTRQAFYRSSGQNSGQAGEWFPFGGILDGGAHDGWFNKLPYVRDELSDTAHQLHRHGSEENRRIGRWLKSQDIPEGVEVPRAELNAHLKDHGAFDEVTERYAGFVEPERATFAGDDPFAGIEPTQVTQIPASSNLAATLPGKLGDPAAPEWQAFTPDDGSLGIPRASMPQIRSEHRGAMVQYLKGRGITHSQVKIAPNTLKPSQAEWSPAKVNRARGFEGTPRSILISADGHVLDGHHQWLSALADAPDAPIKAIRLDAPINQLLIETARFPSSGVDEASAAVAAAVASDGSAASVLPDLSDLADGADSIPVNPNPSPGRASFPCLPERVRKGARDVQDVVNISKAIPASFDDSALFGQGAIIAGARPSLVPGAVADSARTAMSPRKFEAFKQKLVTHPNQPLREDSGLYLASIGQGEETFGSRFAEKLPGVAASQRAYEATLDSLRSNAFDLYAYELKQAGASSKAYNDIARWINVATGRGELGRLEPLADGLNLPMFSPRLLASKFNTVSPLRYMRMEPPARRISLREMFRATGSLTMTMGLAKLAGADVDLDPFSPGFGTIDADGTSYDLSGGRLRPLRYAAQMIDSLNRERRGERVKDERKPAALAEKFFRAYLSPAGQLGADYLTGEDFEGREFGAKEWKPGELKFGELDRLMPFAVKEIRDAYHDAGAIGAVKALPSFVGVGVNTKAKHYPDPIKPALSEPVRRELERIGLDLEHLGKDGQKSASINPNYRTKIVTGDTARAFGGVVGKLGREIEGMGVDAEKVAGEYSAELNEVLTELINSPDWEAFGDDEARARYVEMLILNTHKRHMNGVCVDARGEHLEGERKVGERLTRMSGGSTAPRTMHFKL